MHALCDNSLDLSTAPYGSKEPSQPCKVTARMYDVQATTCEGKEQVVGLVWVVVSPYKDCLRTALALGYVYLDLD
jgi:hypothetical protein